MFFGFFGNKNKIQLKPKHKKQLNDLIIDNTTPATLLYDFETMLKVIQENDHKLTGKNQLKLKTVREINENLQAPLDIRLKRQSQKSYPPIEGLYLLLRASGLSYIHSKGKTSILKIDDGEWLEQWNAFNPTEKYCHLLDSWIIRGFEELIGGRIMRLGMPQVFDKVLSGYSKIGDKGFKIKSYQHFRDEFNFYPETYNLALMDLFGIVTIHQGEPIEGEGWQIDKVERTPFGEALLALLSDILLEQIPKQIDEMQEIFEQFLESPEDDEDHEVDDESLDNISRSISMLHPFMQDYFPAWEKTMQFFPPNNAKGWFTFKVSLYKQWSAEIILDADQSFDLLAHVILEAVNFDSDHLYQFVYQSRFGKEVEIVHPYADGAFTTNEITIGEIGMREGLQLTFIFDFGDWWEFEIAVTAHQPDKTGTKVEVKNVDGDAPEQYPEWDGDDDDFEAFATGFGFFDEN